MRIVRRWADRRRIRELKRSWEAFHALLAHEIAVLEAEEQVIARAAAQGDVVGESNGTRAATPALARSGARAASRAGSIPMEARFLRVKADVAGRLPALGEVVGRRALEQEAAAAQRDMTELLNRVPSLVEASRMPAAERAVILREWHVLYLFLSQLEGAMTGSAIGGAALQAPSDWTRREDPGRRSRLRGLAGFAAEATVIVGFLFLAASILGIGGHDIRRLVRGASPVVQSPETSAGAAVAQPTGETEVTAPAAPSSSSPPAAGVATASPPAVIAAGPAPAAVRPAFAFRTPRLVQPVIVRYGTVGALVLAGAFACGLLLLFGLRSRT